MTAVVHLPEAPPDGHRPVPNPLLPQSLSGQAALVTGANSGIGQKVAPGLTRAGADVVVNYVADPASADAMVAEIEALGRRALAIHADVSNEAKVEAMMAQAVAAFGTLHIVVCNAGLQRDAPFEQMTLAQWNTVIGVNLTGQFLCARSAVREFRRRGPVDVSTALGKIRCMSSLHQRIMRAGHANYSASKGRVKLLMETMAQELAPLRIRVNGIAPGASARRSTPPRGTRRPPPPT